MWLRSKKLSYWMVKPARQYMLLAEVRRFEVLEGAGG